jgi:DNA-binding transcriptional ArsR family regulator
MKIQPNYLYRVLPRLASAGEVKRDGDGWHPVSASATPARPDRPRRPPRAKAAKAAAPATPRSSRRRAAAASSAGDGRASRGATRTAVLSALAGAEAMTASQVASKTGLARPTVSTTLSKLAKSGEVQKADRGYRLAPESEQPALASPVPVE